MTTRPIISKTWFTIALICIGLFLVWVIFRGCAPDNKHVENKATVDSLVKATNELHKKDSAVIAEYTIANKVLAEQTVKQKEKISVLESQLNASGKKANQWSYSLAKAKIIHDTLAYTTSCDSLGALVIDLTNLIDNYQEETHQMVSGYEFQLQYKDSIISIQSTEILRDMNAVKEVGQKYDLLYKDYSRVVKQNKRSRTLTRVLAGLVLVTGAIILTK